MSYVDEIYAKVVEQNPGENEFHQAVKEVLDSLKLVIERQMRNLQKSSFAGASGRTREGDFIPSSVGG